MTFICFVIISSSAFTRSTLVLYSTFFTICSASIAYFLTWLYYPFISAGVTFIPNLSLTISNISITFFISIFFFITYFTSCTFFFFCITFITICIITFFTDISLYTISRLTFCITFCSCWFLTVSWFPSNTRVFIGFNCATRFIIL